MKLRIPKLPKFRMPRRPAQPPQKLEARLRAHSAAMTDAYDDEEPPTRLTGALIVVGLIHVVAVGGIYAFNQIKASHRGPELALPVAAAKTAPPPAATTQTTAQPATNKPAANVPAATAPVAPVLKLRVYNVKPGDTLTGIAKTFNVSITDLKRANNMSNDTIRVGQVLNLPGATAAAETPPAPAKAAEPAETKVSTKTYTVKSGDRLIFIAKKFGVSQEDLVAFNKIKDPSKLQIGQSLKIPTKK